jgi:aryl-alcohol dehydrogenase-like predicted oxidoreductase
MERRDFLKSATVATVAGVGAGLTAVSGAVANAQSAVAPGAAGTPNTHPVTRPMSPDMQYRELGRTGEKVSAIGLGGFHIGKQKEAAESVQIIHAAIDRGITFMDNCWDYNDGTSELRMGEALGNGYRQKVFLMTKIDGRTAEEYNRQLDQSLNRLRTDTIDLVQFHECIRLDDPDRIFAAGGALEAAVAAQKAGKLRFIGFTGHKDPYVHLRMLQMAKQHNFHFDTVQMPINVMDPHFRSFQKEVLPVAIEQGVGVLAMKTFGDNFILQSNTVQPLEALRYGLSQPVSVVITGIDSMPILDQAFAAMKDFKPMTQPEMAALLERTQEAAMAGKYELFKTTNHFDGTIKNPKWLG